ncbi:ATP-grasp domain-containing protein [Streptomyces sp. NPDC048604]|uniref:ATP-grasp domain-containing protein n=1 Tax=Streptomyces sp. NPDC048604 TaxID=3365578 RepID=UPI003724ABD5
MIIDAYSTGRYLPDALRRHGVSCTHVQSSPEVPDFFAKSFPAEAFPASERLVYDETGLDGANLDALVTELRARNPAFVVAGSENGVDLADTLTARLGLPGNTFDARRPRRDKYEMAAAVRAHGLRAPDTLRTEDFDTALSWAKAYDRWPLVVKPADSAGTDNVYFCADTVELCTAFDRILRSRNLMGFVNRTVVLQEYLAGTEYFANTVSVDGRHHVAEIWRYHKRPGRNGSAIYDYEEPLAPDDPAARRIHPYVLSVLDALGVRQGPAHSEIMLTDHGPTLIESGARLAGSIVPEVVDRVFGTNHVALTARALGDPAGFAAEAGPMPALRTNLRYVSLISPAAGRLTSLDRFDRVRALESFAALSLGVDVGDRIAPTVDSATSPGVCYLVHDDAEQIKRDYEALRVMETEDLYEVD